MSQTKVKSGLLNFPDQTDFVKLPSGTTAQRPSSPEKGYSRYNTTDNKLEYWNGTIWQQLPGVVAPTIESVSYPGDDLAADPDGGQTITLTGTNFLDGASIEIDGTTSSVVTVVSKTEITFTSPAKTAGDYDIVLTNGDNTTATFIDGITYNGLPSWTTPAGNLGTFAAGSTIPTITLVATEPDSGVVSYSVTTGALPSGLTLSGADIDGTVPSPAGQTTYNFSVTASDDENQESTERAFNIVVYLQVANTVDEVDPFGDSSGITLYKFDNNLNDSGPGNYNFTVNNGTPTANYISGAFNQGVGVSGPENGVSYISAQPDYYAFSFWGKVISYDDDDDSIFGYNFRRQNYSMPMTRTSLDSNIQLGNELTLPLNTWVFVCITFNPNDSTLLDVYYDGVFKKSVSAGGSGAVFNSKGYGISDSASSPRQYIDQLRTFNRPLTPLEVESLYRERTVVCGGQADTLDILGDNSCIATYQINGNANDLSGNYSGTPTDVSYGVGEFDLAGVFNGSSSKIRTSLNVDNISHTFSCWIKTTQTSDGWIISSRSASGSTQYTGFFNNNGNIELNIAGSTSVSGSGTATNGNWQHCVMTFDNSTSPKVGKLYVDNVLVQHITTTTAVNSGLNVDIGVLVNSTGFFNGSIDQVRIFNKALNSSEVATLYNETACDALSCSGTTNTLDILSDGSCIAAYPLDGSPADLSGNYNGVQTDVTYPVGEFDLAGSFNGSTSYITLPVTQSNDISISAWIKIEDLTRQHQIVSYDLGGVSADRCLQFRVEFDQTVSAYWFSGTKAQSTSSVSQGVWAHVVATWEDNGTQKIYFNGVQEDSNAATTRVNFPNLYAGKRSIGGGTVDDFLGEIDQVRIFNKALSAGEVTTLYNETACN